MFEAPYSPYDPSDKTGFTYETVSDRWPNILTIMINGFGQVIDKLTNGKNSSADLVEVAAKVQEGINILEKIKRLKDRISSNLQLEPLPDDGEPHVVAYNSELTRLAECLNNTWFTAPWLFSECYLYRLLRSFFSVSRYWTDFDPFFAQKADSLKRNSRSIYQIALAFQDMARSTPSLQIDPAKAELLFRDMIQMSLRGNTADLSRFVNLSSNSQVFEELTQRENGEFILKNDQSAVWQCIKTLQHGRIDIVLDNAGFELFTDLAFADFLVTFTPYVAQVVFHPKLIPWFVSDVTPFDFKSTLASLCNVSVFPAPFPASGGLEALHALENMVARWNQYLQNGVFMLSVPEDTALGGGCEVGSMMTSFWTSPWPYWNMQTHANTLWKWFRGSGLVVFKGDLNYRKLTGDVQWPVSTSFSDAIGPLSGSFSLVSLCMSKSDVVVGVASEVAEKLDYQDKTWRVNGKFALVSFVPAS